ncbi:8203_t:CDS:2 [Funneliformis geosporum]|nr:8203_t:CDS:2 [Funneliformis geosporum]
MTYNLLPDKIILSQEQTVSIEQSKNGLYISVLEFLFDLSLSGVIEQVLANAEEEKCSDLTKNIYHFINKEKHGFMVEYDSICFDSSCLDMK